MERTWHSVTRDATDGDVQVPLDPAEETLGQPGGVGHLLDGEPLRLPGGTDPGTDGNRNVARFNW